MDTASRANTLKMIRQLIPAYFVTSQVARVSPAATARSFIPRKKLFLENEEHTPDTPTNITIKNGWTNAQNQFAVRNPNMLRPN